MATLQEVLLINRNGGGRGGGERRGRRGCIFNGHPLLSLWKTCQASIVCDGEFPGVCALFTGSCRPTFCEAVATSSWHPESARVSAVTQVRSHRLITGEKGRILKVPVTPQCTRPFVFLQIFSFFFLFTWEKSLNETETPPCRDATIFSSAPAQVHTYYPWKALLDPYWSSTSTPLVINKKLWQNAERFCPQTIPSFV